MKQIIAKGKNEQLELKTWNGKYYWTQGRNVLPGCHQSVRTAIKWLQDAAYAVRINDYVIQRTSHDMCEF